MSNLIEAVLESTGKDVSELSKIEQFETWCTYNGYLGGCAYEVRDAIEEIFGIDLYADIDQPIDLREQFVGKYVYLHERNCSSLDYYDNWCKVVALDRSDRKYIIVEWENGLMPYEITTSDRVITTKSLFANANCITDVSDIPLSPWETNYRHWIRQGFTEVEAKKQADNHFPNDETPVIDDVDNSFEDVPQDLSPWVECYQNALKEGFGIDESIKIADEQIGRGEFTDEQDDDTCGGRIQYGEPNGFERDYE